MFLAAEEAPFVLQGPRPPVPPPAWETAWILAVTAIALVALAVYLVRRFLRAAPKPLAPLAQLELSLRLAETQPATEAVGQATRALRAYLAAIEPRAAPSLSTEELIALLSGLPVFLPARQPLLAALRSADGVKFAGASLEPSLLIAGIREAARRVEDARRTFARPVPPVVPVRPPATSPTPSTSPTPPPLLLVPTPLGAAIPVAPVEPPPLPGPPPLPRRDHA